MCHLNQQNHFRKHLGHSIHCFGELFISYSENVGQQDLRYASTDNRSGAWSSCSCVQNPMAEACLNHGYCPVIV